MISTDQLDEWIAVPVEALAERARVPLTVVETPEAVHERFADDLWQEISGAKEEGRDISIIVPLGPVGQYRILADRVNARGLSLEHVTFFGMDEWLDWQGRPLPVGHPFSLEGRFSREFLELIAADFRPHPANVIFPSSLDLDQASDEISRRGTLVGTFGGVGFQGHVAFNEPPASRWTRITTEELSQSQTRIVPLAVDTIIAHAQRSAGGNVFAVPPMAVTLGMSSLLAAPKVRLYIDTGTWKRTILRILLFADPDVDYPVTLVSGHRDVRVVADRNSALPPAPSSAI
jgi:glucosamine-6-phosphate deaminase